MKLAPQTLKCFTSGCNNSFLSNPQEYADKHSIKIDDPVDTSAWIRHAKYNWLADVDRWFCSNCFARIAYVRQQLPIAIMEFHSYALLSGAVTAGSLMGEAARFVIVGKIEALRRVAALRAEEHDFFPEEV